MQLEKSVFWTASLALLLEAVEGVFTADSAFKKKMAISILWSYFVSWNYQVPDDTAHCSSLCRIAKGVFLWYCYVDEIRKMSMHYDGAKKQS
ncbi:hypothetical protein MASR1M66_07490 [Aminivibrio sp.]